MTVDWREEEGISLPTAFHPGRGGRLEACRRPRDRRDTSGHNRERGTFMGRMANDAIDRGILRTLLYYDIWGYPLKAEEILRFLPERVSSAQELGRHLERCAARGLISEASGYYSVRTEARELAELRGRKERRAALMWKAARLSAGIIKTFPFVRGVFVSGELSKNVASPRGDIDFLILTEPGRLWIARSLLTLFKKIFLLNKKKFFCINYFVAAGHCSLDAGNIYLASEVAHLKPLYNVPLFREYMRANQWIEMYFPAFSADGGATAHASDRRSVLQRLFEAPFRLIDCSTLDDALMGMMQRVWARRYPQYDDATRNRIFRSTKHESRAYGGDFEHQILALYEERLRQFGVAD